MLVRKGLARHWNQAGTVISEEWIRGTLQGRSNLSDDVILLTFGLPVKRRFPIGHCVTIQTLDQEDHLLPHRTYVPLQRRSQEDFFDVAIKIHQHGALTQRLAKLALGEQVDLQETSSKLPPGLLTSDLASPRRPLCMVAGGTGITPMLQIIRDTLEQDSTLPHSVHLLYSCRTVNDILFREELDTYDDKFASFKVHYFVGVGGLQSLSFPSHMGGRISREPLLRRSAKLPFPLPP
jgi:cytochrome-b5 reductase